RAIDRGGAERKEDSAIDRAARADGDVVRLTGSGRKLDVKSVGARGRRGRDLVAGAVVNHEHRGPSAFGRQVELDVGGAGGVEAVDVVFAEQVEEPLHCGAGSQGLPTGKQ